MNILIDSTDDYVFPLNAFVNDPDDPFSNEDILQFFNTSNWETNIEKQISDSSSTCTKKAIPKKKLIHKATAKKKNTISSEKHRMRRKEEVCNLKRQVEELETTLTNLRSLQNLKTAFSSPWEIEARNQRLLRDQALAENKRLKKMIEEQKDLTSCLQKVLQQKPKLQKQVLSTYGTEISGVLGTDPVQRRCFMEAILDRQYRRLSSVLLQTGMVDVSEELNFGHFVPSHYGREDFEVLKHRIFENLDFRQLSTAILKFCRAINLMPELDAKVLEDIDYSTVYTKFKLGNVGEPIVEAKLLARQYVEPNRIVFACTSIGTDELFPDNPNLVQPADCSWLIVEDATDKNFPHIKKTRMRVVTKSAIHFKPVSLEENLAASREYNQIVQQNTERYMQNYESLLVDMAKLEVY